MAPDFRPAGLAVAIQAFAIGVGRSLVVALQEEDFGNAIVRQRTVLVDVERLVELEQCARKIALLGKSSGRAGWRLAV